MGPQFLWLCGVKLKVREKVRKEAANFMKTNAPSLKVGPPHSYQHAAKMCRRSRFDSSGFQSSSTFPYDTTICSAGHSLQSYSCCPPVHWVARGRVRIRAPAPPDTVSLRFIITQFFASGDLTSVPAREVQSAHRY